MKTSKKYTKKIKQNYLITLAIITTAILTLTMFKLAEFSMPKNRESISSITNAENYAKTDGEINEINTENEPKMIEERKSK